MLPIRRAHPSVLFAGFDFGNRDMVTDQQFHANSLLDLLIGNKMGEECSFGIHSLQFGINLHQESDRLKSQLVVKFDPNYDGKNGGVLLLVFWSSGCPNSHSGRLLSKTLELTSRFAHA